MENYEQIISMGAKSVLHGKGNRPMWFGKLCPSWSAFLWHSCLFLIGQLLLDKKIPNKMEGHYPTMWEAYKEHQVH